MEDLMRKCRSLNISIIKIEQKKEDFIKKDIKKKKVKK